MAFQIAAFGASSTGDAPRAVAFRQWRDEGIALPQRSRGSRQRHSRVLIARQFTPGAPPDGRVCRFCIAVWNLSSDPEQGYFASGITDDLTTDLSQISEHFAIASGTAFTYDRESAIRSSSEGRLALTTWSKAACDGQAVGCG